MYTLSKLYLRKRKKWISKSKSKSKWKSPSLDNLVDELLTDILIRVPVDAVHRCKTISKRWLSLISSPEFARRYVLHKPSCQRTIIYHYSYQLEDDSDLDPFGVAKVIESEKKPSSWRIPSKSKKKPTLLKPFSFNFLPINPEEFEKFAGVADIAVYLAGSCNGLLLCSAKPEGRRRTMYYICNPLTKKWVLLPTPPPLIVNGKTVDVDILEERAGFVCDNGFHDDNRRYKVILFPEHDEDEDEMMPSVKIFSFCCESGNWSEIDVELPRGFSWGPHISNIVSYNGMLYGLFSEGVFTYDPFNKPDELKLIDFPEDVHIKYKMDACIGVVEGKIRVCHLSIGSDFEFYIDMWEVEDFSNRKWCKIYHQFCLSDTVQVFSWDLKWRDGIRPQFVKSISEIDGDVIYIFDRSSIFWCNLRTKVLESLFHISAFKGGISNFVSIVLPWWPTPVPNINPEAQLLIN